MIFKGNFHLLKTVIRNETLFPRIATGKMTGPQGESPNDRIISGQRDLTAAANPEKKGLPVPVVHLCKRKNPQSPDMRSSEDLWFLAELFPLAPVRSFLNRFAYGI